MKDIAHFIAGFKRFRQQYFDPQEQRFATLQQGQNPKVLVIGCSDSRVESGSLLLHGWYFDISIGQLYSYAPETAGFEPLG